jgi:hypothetical protein
LAWHQCPDQHVASQRLTRIQATSQTRGSQNKQCRGIGRVYKRWILKGYLNRRKVPGPAPPPGQGRQTELYNDTDRLWECFHHAFPLSLGV